VLAQTIGLNFDRRKSEIGVLRIRRQDLGTTGLTAAISSFALKTEDLDREWKNSCTVLSEIVQHPIATASVAGGYYSRKVAEAAAAAGIHVLFTSEPTASIHIVNGCLILGRYSIQSFTNPTVTGAIVAGHLWRRWRQILLWNTKKVLKGLGGETYVNARRKLLSHIMSAQTVARR